MNANMMMNSNTSIHSTITMSSSSSTHDYSYDSSWFDENDLARTIWLRVHFQVAMRRFLSQRRRRQAAARQQVHLAPILEEREFDVDVDDDEQVLVEKVELALEADEAELARELFGADAALPAAVAEETEEEVQHQTDRRRRTLMYSHARLFGCDVSVPLATDPFEDQDQDQEQEQEQDEGQEQTEDDDAVSVSLSESVFPAASGAFVDIDMEANPFDLDEDSEPAVDPEGELHPAAERPLPVPPSISLSWRPPVPPRPSVRPPLPPRRPARPLPLPPAKLAAKALAPKPPARPQSTYSQLASRLPPAVPARRAQAVVVA